jgi:hypothetical protein
MLMRISILSNRVILGLCGFMLCAGLLTGAYGSGFLGGAQDGPAPGEFPELKTKPKPAFVPFNDCPPEGNGGDPELNRLKNREDEAKWLPVAHHTILDLPWPRSVDKMPRSSWRAAAKALVEKYEGTPISVVGHIVQARMEGPESCNCKKQDKDMRDIHVWVTAEPGEEDRNESFIAEVTPRIRKKHPGWNATNLNSLAKDEVPVRISGWLLLDQEHPEQLNHTRGTLWEIHPIMDIEVKKGNGWVRLGDKP